MISGILELPSGARRHSAIIAIHEWWGLIDWVKENTSFAKEAIVEPTRLCVLLHTKMEGNGDFLKNPKTYIPCDPHLEVGGGNNAFVAKVSGRQLFDAEKEDGWQALQILAATSDIAMGTPT